MPSRISSILSLAPKEQESIEKPVGEIRTLSEWFIETVEAAKETPIYKHLGSLGESAKEWSGVVKAIGKLVERLTEERSAQVLGWLACSIAYRIAASKAIRLFGPPSSHVPFASAVVAERIKKLRLDDPSIMTGFSLKASGGHPLLRAADEGLVAVLEAGGYDAAEQRNILRTVRASFKAALQDLLTGDQKDRFAPFTQWLQLDTDDQRLQETLLAHAELQRAELEDQPALAIEPFAIADVYIQTECGCLSWKTIRDDRTKTGERIDPFSEESAPRQDLMSTVLGYIGNKKFNDCVVIQGAPGAGKSTFAKKLCARLQGEGLIPVRIPLQYLRVDANILDAIQDVIVGFSGLQGVSFRRDLLPEKVFSERVSYNEAEISPYVFIFDGWDEISLSAAEGFHQRVERLLDSIRQTFINQNRNKVRVVLTGRPSQAVGRTNFLRDSTPVLTIRSLRPGDLDQYLKDLAMVLKKPAFKGDDIDSWTVGDLDRYAPVLRRYSEAFPNVGGLEVLGQPLLAHLATKVMASFKGNLSELITPPTSLYRHLVDLTCQRGGKYPTKEDSSGKSGRIEGRDLRALLHGTALAITAHGSESIPMDELDLRLKTLGVGRDVFQITKEHPLTNLMISFYFKGIHEQAGCEFLHKSFREYLAAEGIVEVLKEFSKIATEPFPERPKERYWQDFQGSDPRYWLTRKLGEMCSAQWLSREIISHLEKLILWEVQRSDESKNGSHGSPGKSTEAIPISAWEKIRDGLVDIWDWWGEGVHLRPQPKEEDKVWRLDDPPYVVTLIKRAMHRFNVKLSQPPRPPRAATVDANLGYALFQLNCFLHAFIAESEGWMQQAQKLGAASLWSNIQKSRRYQTAITLEGKTFFQFAPSGTSNEYFRNYIQRINGAGVNPAGRDFPTETFMRGVNLSEANLVILNFSHSDLQTANLQRANCSGTVLEGTKLDYCTFRSARLYSAHCLIASLEYADFEDANVMLADLRTNLGKVLNLSQKQLDKTAVGQGEINRTLKVPPQWEALSNIDQPEDAEEIESESKI